MKKIIIKIIGKKFHIKKDNTCPDIVYVTPEIQVKNNPISFLIKFD